jgi:hypothetical protein
MLLHDVADRGLGDGKVYRRLGADAQFVDPLLDSGRDALAVFRLLGAGDFRPRLQDSVGECLIAGLLHFRWREAGEFGGFFDRVAFEQVEDAELLQIAFCFGHDALWEWVCVLMGIIATF